MLFFVKKRIMLNIAIIDDKEYIEVMGYILVNGEWIKM